MLPAPGTLSVSSNMTLDASTTNLPKQLVTQSDGTTLVVIHLSALSVSTGTTLTLDGGAVAFAVDGSADIGGTIVAIGGNDHPMQCQTARGHDATESTNGNGGGGGGGGAAGAAGGGGGGDGAGTQPGTHGAGGSALTSNLSPLRGGCRGGAGGRWNQTGSPTPGGRGGGALQISTNTKINITFPALIDAAGRGGTGGPTAQVGAGGAGSGGGIFLEGPAMAFDFGVRICADGGSGGEGGGSTVGGHNGSQGECSGLAYATTRSTTGTNGGSGGHGGYWITTGGGGGGGASSDAGGGGGGGGVGWIRIKSPSLTDNGAVVTPTAVQN